MKSTIDNSTSTSSSFRSCTPLEMIFLMRMSSTKDISFDASSFSHIISPPSRLPPFNDSSYASQGGVPKEICLLNSQVVSGLSRSQCIRNKLSALGSRASETTIPRKAAKQGSRLSKEEGWGYFVDTPHSGR